jgi:hypothetical protein
MRVRLKRSPLPVGLLLEMPVLTLEAISMTDNLESVLDSGTYSAPSGGSCVAPSCYRVAVVLGSIDVSARLKNADDLELLEQSP